MSNEIHPTAIVAPTVKMGRGNKIGPYCIIRDNVEMGDDNILQSHVSIGEPPEHLDFFKGSKFGVRIGSNCVFREFASVNAGMNKNTIIGNRVVLMTSSHVCHDGEIEDRVILSCNVMLAGHVHVMEGANLGMGILVHQYARVGPYCMLGMGTVVTKKSAVEPFGVYVGTPAKRIRDNTIGIQRAQLSEVQLEVLKKRYFSAK